MMASMKVIVFGATGGTGQATVRELLDGAHEVTAFSRHAAQLGIRAERLIHWLRRRANGVFVIYGVGY